MIVKAEAVLRVPHEIVLHNKRNLEAFNELVGNNEYLAKIMAPKPIDVLAAESDPNHSKRITLNTAGLGILNPIVDFKKS